MLIQSNEIVIALATNWEWWNCYLSLCNLFLYSM